MNSHLAPQPQPDDTLTQAADLEADVLQHIPLARAMQMHIHAWDGEHIVVHAPLGPNINDKGCAFGGSLASLMTLAPWAMLELGLRQAGLDADLFVADAEIRYLAPLFDDIEIHAESAPGQSTERFRDMLRSKGKARISVRARVGDDDHPVCVQTARFVAKLRGR